MTATADLDFDALEALFLSVKRDAAGAVSRPTFPIDVDAAIALIALARRTVETEGRAADLEASTLADIEAVTEAESESLAVREGARADAAERERDALRDAVIHLGTLQMQRRRDVLEAWAIRQTANDLSAPFSDERVQARLAEYLAKEPTP